MIRAIVANSPILMFFLCLGMFIYALATEPEETNLEQ